MTSLVQIKNLLSDSEDEEAKEDDTSRQEVEAKAGGPDFLRRVILVTK